MTSPLLKIFPGLQSPKAWLIALGTVSAAGLGLKAGYDFGCEVSGVGMGWLMAFNSAAFCVLIFSTLVDWGARLIARISAGIKPG